jgi:hypothetical protein
MKFYAFGNLRVQRLLQVAIGGIEGIVVAVCAPTHPFRPVAVGAGKACIYDNLLNAAAKCFPDIFSI